MRRLEQRLRALELRRSAKRWPPWIMIRPAESDEAALQRAEDIYGPMPSHHHVVALEEDITHEQWQLEYSYETD